MWTLVTLTLLTVQAEIGFAGVAPSPSPGDIRIKSPTIEEDGTVYGEAQVIFTDGFSAPTWSSICSENFEEDEASVFCTQLGYGTGKTRQSTLSSGTDPIWIKSIVCPLGLTHIFHCNYTIKHKNEPCVTQKGDYIANVECSDRIVIPPKPYIGQVALCPPNIEDQSNRYLTQSVSFGIISLYFYGEWGAFTFDSGSSAVPEVVTHHRGNLICRQMGFERVIPESIQTLSSYQSYYNYSFSECFDSDNKGITLLRAWLTTEDLNCQSQNYKDEDCTSTRDDPCFSCCFEHPRDDINKRLPPENYIVLQCIYDVYNENYVPYGNVSICSFKDKDVGNNITKYHQVCAAGSHGFRSSRKGFKAVLGLAIIFGVTTVLFIILLICYCCYLYHKKKKNPENDRLIGNSQPSIGRDSETR